MFKEKTVLMFLVILIFNFVLFEQCYSQDSKLSNYTISKEVLDFFSNVEIFLNTYYSSGWIKLFHQAFPVFFPL